MEGTAREIGRFIFSADLVKPATGARAYVGAGGRASGEPGFNWIGEWRDQLE
jgi:hypothetical protein